MKQFDPDILARWCGGEWRGGKPRAISGFSIDTRALRAGDVFIALQGEHADGHRFLPAAFAAGAAAVVINRDQAEACALPGPALAVRDAGQALWEMARGHRGDLTATLVGVTGSVGKTTVKEMLAGMLATVGATAKTKGNWNNHLGLPLSLLSADRTDRFGVFEIGMNHPDELSPLCELLRAEVGVMTRIGPVHLAHFDSVRAIAEEKASMIKALPADGLAVLTLDDDWVDLFKAAAPCRIITTSLRDPSADYFAGPVGSNPDEFEVRCRARKETGQFHVPIPGEHMRQNALLAIAAAHELGASWSGMRDALRKFSPPPMRWQRVVLDQIEFINDSYNANPVSMRAALNTFAQLPSRSRKWLVLAGMRELGPTEKEEHLRLGRDLAQSPWAGLVTVGAMGAGIAEGAEQAGFEASRIARCENHGAAVRELKRLVGPGDLVLLKASRGEQLEKILEAWGGV